MTYEISTLIAQSHDVAEICAGAFGYLSAAVDEYLHSDDVSQDTLHADFHRLQNEVTKGLQRVFHERNLTMHDVAMGSGEAATALGLPPEHVKEVVRKALKLVFPLEPVTEP